MLANRLKKRFKHLKKWAKRSNVTCFRVYEKDIPEFPLIVDWYDGDVVVWLKDRKKDETEHQKAAFKELCITELKDAFEIENDRLFIKERRRQREEGHRQQYQKIQESSVIKTILEQGLQFEVNLSDYLDTGLFLDHRIARNTVREIAKGLNVLNLFAYTGSFSVYAMDGFANTVTTVDLSNTYIAWSERNMKLNNLYDPAKTKFHVADCLHWVKEAKSSQLKYDLIVCDPPTFSNSKKMQDSSFSIDRDHPWLLLDLGKLLNPKGKIFFSNNSRSFQLDQECLDGFEIEPWTHKSISEDFRNTKIHQSWWLTKK